MSTRGFIGFRKNGVVKGFYNHSDSYPEWLGIRIVEDLYSKHSWEIIKDFFLNRLRLVPDEKAYSQHKSFFDLNFTKDSAVLQDGKDFYKDGLYCEYSYIFDLDSPVKKLLLFEGFGKKPAKGYEDWFYEGHDKKKYFTHPCGFLKGDMPSIIAYATMCVKYFAREKKGSRVKTVALLRKILASPKKDLPKFIGRTADKQVNELIEWKFSQPERNSHVKSCG